MLSRSKKWVWLIALLVVVAGGFFFFRQRAASQTVAEDAPETAVAVIGDLAKSATASGQVEAQRSSQLQFTTSGTVAKVFVAVGDRVAARDPLVQLETAVLERAVANAEQTLLLQQANLAELQTPATQADIIAAETAVASAEANLAAVAAGPDAEQIAAAEASLRAAQADIAAAAARLNEATSSGTATEIEAARLKVELADKAKVEAEEAHVFVLVSDRFSDEQREQIEPQRAAAVLQARADLAAAQEELTTLQSGNPNTVAANRASVAAATASRDVAQAQLAQLRESPTAADIAAAEATLADAKASLDSLLRGPTEAQLAIAQAQVAQAEIQLTQAKQNLEEALLVAPFAGLITAVSVAPGEQAAGVVIEMVDMDSLELVLSVDEVDIGLVEVGQTAVVTLETWPDSDIDSQVTAIEPVANLDSSDVVTFNIHLNLVQTDLPVLIGMTANASLATANRQNVLIVPNAAITVDRSSNTYTVNRIERDAEGNITTTEVEVTIGLSDNQATEISSGLAAGDELLLGSLADLQNDGGPDGPPGRGFNR